MLSFCGSGLNSSLCYGCAVMDLFSCLQLFWALLCACIVGFSSAIKFIISIEKRKLRMIELVS